MNTGDSRGMQGIVEGRLTSCGNPMQQGRRLTTGQRSRHPAGIGVWLTVTPAQLESVGRALAQHDEVPFAAAVSGSANLVASVTCQSLEHLYGYVTTKIGAIAGVHSLEISPVLRRIKQAGAFMVGDRLANPEPPPRADARRTRQLRS